MTGRGVGSDQLVVRLRELEKGWPDVSLELGPVVLLMGPDRAEELGLRLTRLARQARSTIQETRRRRGEL